MVDGIQGFGLFGEWVGLKHVVQSESSRPPTLHPPSSTSASFELELQERAHHTWPREPLFLKECVDSLVKKNQGSECPGCPWGM